MKTRWAAAPASRRTCSGVPAPGIAGIRAEPAPVPGCPANSADSVVRAAANIVRPCRPVPAAVVNGAAAGMAVAAKPAKPRQPDGTAAGLLAVQQRLLVLQADWAAALTSGENRPAMHNSRQWASAHVGTVYGIEQSIGDGARCNVRYLQKPEFDVARAAFWHALVYEEETQNSVCAQCAPVAASIERSARIAGCMVAGCKLL